MISVFILSLSIGYWLGGRLADRAESNCMLAWGNHCGNVLPDLADLYDPNARGLWQYRAGNGGDVGAGDPALFTALVVAGVRSPLLVRLVFVDAERVGRTTGTLYAIDPAAMCLVF